MGGRSLADSVVVLVEGAVVAEVLSTPVSGTSSSSISNGRTVVGDSGAATSEIGLSLGLLWEVCVRRQHLCTKHNSSSTQQHPSVVAVSAAVKVVVVVGSYNGIGGGQNLCPGRHDPMPLIRNSPRQEGWTLCCCVGIMNISNLSTR